MICDVNNIIICFEWSSECFAYWKIGSLKVWWVRFSILVSGVYDNLLQGWIKIAKDIITIDKLLHKYIHIWASSQSKVATTICRETKNVLFIWFIFLQRKNISNICDKKLDSLLMEWVSVSSSSSPTAVCTVVFLVYGVSKR